MNPKLETVIQVLKIAFAVYFAIMVYKIYLAITYVSVYSHELVLQ